jgi:hypothetical protein
MVCNKFNRGLLPPLNMAIHLNNLQYQAVMLATGIMLRKGNQTTITLRHLEFLKTALQENMTIHITRCFLQNKNHYFISVDYPTHSTPAKQVRADPRIIIRRGSTQLDDHTLLLLNHLQTDREEAEGAIIEVEPPVDCQDFPNEEEAIVEQAEPLLVEEEEEVRELAEQEEQQQHILPSQHTDFYRQQCLLFEEQFNEWVRHCKKEQLL